MGALALASFTTSLLTVTLGLLVYWMSTHLHMKRLWFLFSLFVALWSFGFGMVIIAEDEASALFWARAFQNPAAIFIPVAFLHFVLVSLNTLSEKKRRLIVAGYLFGFLLLALNFTDSYTVVKHIPRARMYAISARELYVFYLLFFCAYIGISFYEMLKKHRFAREKGDRARVLYFTLASAVGFLGGASTFLLDFGLTTHPIGIYLVPLYVMLVAYAILEHQLLDVQHILKKGIAYTVLLLTMIIPLYLLGILLVFLLKRTITIQINLFSLNSMLMSFIAIFFGLFVYFNDEGNPVNRRWMAFSAAFAVWSLTNSFLTSSSDRSMALFWDRFGHIGVILIPITYLHFILRFLGKDIAGARKRILTVGYVLSGIFTAINVGDLFLATSLLIEDERPIASFAYYTKPGRLYLPLFSVFCILVLYAIFQLIVSYRKSAGLRRNQIMYVLLASVLGFSGGLMNFLPVFDIDLHPYGNYLVPLYIFTMSYAIVKYRLMDINILIKKSFTYAVLLLLTSIPAFLFILWAEKIYFHTVSFQFTILFSLLLALAALGFYFIVIAGGEEAIAGLLFRSEYDSSAILADFTQAMVSILDLRQLTAKLIQTLSLAMGIEKVSLFLLSEKQSYYQLAAAGGTNEAQLQQLEIPVTGFFSRWLKEKRELVLREELERSLSDSEGKAEIVEMLSRMESELCIPLISKDQLIGFCNLGHKASHGVYSREDLQLLTSLSRQAAIAIENARLFKEVRLQAEQLLRSEKLRTLGEVASRVAHDFNNILAAITTRTELLMMKADRPDLRRGLEIIEKAAMDGAVMVRNLQKNFTQRQAEREYGAADLNQAISDALAFTQARWKDEAHRRGVRYEVIEALGEIPPVKGDISELREALTNLILNALDAMPQGGKLILETALVPGQQTNPPPGESKSWVEVRITDTGHGMTEDIKRQAFDPFFTTKGVKGSGLGLYVVESIIQRHQGRIRLESEPGKGTTFFIQLQPSTGLERERLQESDHLIGKPARILVIEDEEAVLEALAESLESCQHYVTLARTGEEGLKVLEKERFDIVFTDLGLPGLSGWDVAKAVKSANDKVTVVLVTGWGVTVDQEKAKRDGVDFVVAKPFTVEHVRHLVAEVMTGEKRDSEAEATLRRT